MLKIGKISKNINYKTIKARRYKINIKNQNYPIKKKDKLKKFHQKYFKILLLKIKAWIKVILIKQIINNKHF